jgi:hypothetical protein
MPGRVIDGVAPHPEDDFFKQRPGVRVCFVPEVIEPLAGDEWQDCEVAWLCMRLAEVITRLDPPFSIWCWPTSEGFRYMEEWYCVVLSNIDADSPAATEFLARFEAELIAAGLWITDDERGIDIEPEVASSCRECLPFTAWRWIAERECPQEGG